MTRRRYIQDPQTHQLVEVTQDYQPALRTDSGALWGDRHYDGVRATDGSDISTRTKHREYMRANNLTTTDDFSASWTRAQEARQRYFQQGGSIRRADVERAIHQVTTRR